jgi:fused signal recognition particle receptor
MLGFSRKPTDDSKEDTENSTPENETKKFWGFGFKKSDSAPEPSELAETDKEIDKETEKKLSSVSTIDVDKEEIDETTEAQPKVGFFQRLKQGLSRTRENLTTGLAALFADTKAIDDDLLEEIENLLLMADVGIESTQLIIDDLHKRVAKEQLKESGQLYTVLKENMQNLLKAVEQPLDIPENLDAPYVILMIGINGAGKTTTIGKLAKRFQKQGKSVMLAAGDTFRAAAVEQLKVWGERNDVAVVAQHDKADAAAVIFDALESAKAKKIDVLIADTAGRLHTQNHLMDELKKVKRVISRVDENAPHEVMLVLDATIGQNALAQAKEFNKAIGITGINITKLDGTAKGGIIFAVAHQLALPIRFIGVGEKIDDLRVFNAQQFVEALLTTQEEEQEG